MARIFVYITHKNGIIDDSAAELAAAAKKIALDAGLPRGSYPLELDFRYVGHPDFGPGTAWDDTYIWEVRAWIDPPDSNPRSMNFAVVDPSSGVVYEIGKLSIGYIGFGP